MNLYYQELRILYGIMVECIKEDPTERPNIEEVYEIVKLLESGLLILAVIL